MDVSEMLTPGQAAQVIGVARSRVYQFLKKGKLPHIRISGCYLISRSVAENFTRNKSGRPRKSNPVNSLS